MTSSATHTADDPKTSRLLIHFDGRLGLEGGQATSHAPLQWLRQMLPKPPPAFEQPVLCVRVDDLNGQKVFELDRAGALTEVSLPGGTYCITARLGHVCRRYTMTLENSGLFNLYLR